MLLPGNLADGIEPSDDPMIDVRDQAYAVSFGRRSEVTSESGLDED
jgi:catalase